MHALMGLFWLLAALLGGADDDPACLVLGGLDSVRAQAFVTGDERRLRDVYVDDRAARADVQVLRAYSDRGLRLEGMRLVRGSCRVARRSAKRITLDVVDRLGPTTAWTPDGVRRDLPHDRPTRRTVVLARDGEVWRIAAVGTDDPDV